MFVFTLVIESKEGEGPQTVVEAIELAKNAIADFEKRQLGTDDAVMIRNAKLSDVGVIALMPGKLVAHPVVQPPTKEG